MSLAAAAAILLAGWLAAGWAERAVAAALRRVKAGDAMVNSFFASLARWALLVVVALAALERLGVQTTSVVAMLGAAGLAVGLALQNTLASLAAGVMLLLFRPFKVGDAIECGTVAGTVQAVSLFHVDLVTADNIRVVTPNALLWGAALRNLSALPTRRLALTVPVPYPADAEAAVARLQSLLAAEPRVAAEPAPTVAMARFTDKATEIEVQLWCDTADLAALKADLMAALWRECMKGLV
jgi:small conductance mechanosensitive channel